MARRPKKSPPAEETTDRHGFHALLERHVEHLRVIAYSEETIEKRLAYVRRFARWCAERAVRRPSEVTKPILERYQRHLYQHRKQDGQPLAFASQQAELVALRTFFAWLAKQNHVLFNPAAEIDLPRCGLRLPKHVLTAKEMERVLAQIDLADPLGVRDRAIVETLYSTGLRRSELCHLELYDVDGERGLVRVRQGKGRKDRVVPIGERAFAWVERYRLDVRPALVVRHDDATLFLCVYGDPLRGDHLTRIVHRYVAAAELGKQGSCHLLRHTMATLMLENGADVRFIQELLGHENLSTTQVYTHVAIAALKEVHTATHPARLDRASARVAAEASAADDEAEELLSSLAAEADDEAGDEEDADR